MKLKAVLLSLTFAFIAVADARYFTNPYPEFSDFLDLATGENRIYVGTRGSRVKCEIQVSKTPTAITFRPLHLASDMTFVVHKDAKYDVNGGTENEKLWSSYFIDDPGEFVIHGQFGVSYRIELEKSPEGFKTFSYTKYRAMDLGGKLLGRADCRNLKLRTP